MKKGFLLIWIMVSAALILGGQDDVKTLEQKLADTRGEKRVEILNQLASHYLSKSPKKSLRYAFEACDLAEKLSDRRIYSTACSNLANAYHQTGQYDKALEFFLKTLKIKGELGDEKGIILCLNRIGTVYQIIKNYDKALENYNLSLNRARDIKDLNGISRNLNSIGIVYWYQKKYQQARELYQESLEIKNQLSDKAGISAALNNIAMIYHIEGKFDQALDYYQRSLKIKEEIGNQVGIAGILGNIGELYASKKNYQTAIDYIKRSMNLAKSIEAKEYLRNSYYSLSELYEVTGNHKTALEYQKLYTRELDTIYNKQTKRISDIQSSVDTEKHLKEIELLKKDKEINQLELYNQKILTRAFILGSILLALIGALIFNRFLIKRKAARELQKAMDKIKQLGGLVPICGWCKKIRDDKGYWQEVETYVASRSAAEFSHGICPHCAIKIRNNQKIIQSDR